MRAWDREGGVWLVGSFAALFFLLFRKGKVGKRGQRGFVYRTEVEQAVSQSASQSVDSFTA